LDPELATVKTALPAGACQVLSAQASSVTVTAILAAPSVEFDVQPAEARVTTAINAMAGAATESVRIRRA